MLVERPIAEVHEIVVALVDQAFQSRRKATWAKAVALRPVKQGQVDRAEYLDAPSMSASNERGVGEPMPQVLRSGERANDQ